MRTLLLLTLLLSVVASPVLAQQPIKTPPKNILFKDAAYWKVRADERLKSAPAGFQQKINSKNADFQKQGKSLRMTYTSVSDIPLNMIAGFYYDQKRNIPLDSRPLDGPAPPMCLTITARATDRKVDMRDFGIITNIRNQDGCGGCWAFASIAAFETAILLKNGGDASTLNLSEAQLLTCGATTPGKCGGGIQGDAIGYLKDHFIKTEPEDSFWWPNINTQSCNSFSANTRNFKAHAGGWVSGSIFNPSPGNQSIKEAICRYGSVAASLQATDNFKDYSSGVYDLSDNTTLFPTHVIQIIGWDDDQQAWLIKNSWGEGWGIGGFGWVKYNTNLIGAYAIWIEAEPSADNPCVQVTNNPYTNPTSNSGGSYEELLGRFPYPQIIRLQSVDNNLTVEVDDPVIGGDNKGRDVQQWSGHGQIFAGSDGRNQEWWFLPVGKDGNRPLYRILNSGFAKFLTDNAGNVYTENENGSNNQLWLIENSGTAGVYYFRNFMSGKYLQVLGDHNEGSNLVLIPFTGHRDQQFRVGLTRTNFLGDKENTKIFIVPSHSTDKALDLTAGNYHDGTQLQIWQKTDGNGNQAFQITWDGDAQAYSIFCKTVNEGNKCMEVLSFNQNNGGRVGIWEKVGGPNQYWYIIPLKREGEKFLIINKNSGKSLDVSGVGKNNGTPVGQWDFVNGDNQKWEFRKWQ